MKSLVIALLLFFNVSLSYGYDVTMMALHPAPAEHFIAYAQVLKEYGISYRIFAQGVALDKFKSAGEKPISLPLELTNSNTYSLNGLDELCDSLNHDKVILVDGSHPIFEDLFSKLDRPTKVLYYDNFEPYVPGGYSSRMAKMAEAPIDAVLFASTNLPSQTLFEEPGSVIDFSKVKRYGIGYYCLDLSSFEKAEKRRASLKVDLLNQCSLPLEDLHVFLYLGGANSYYFDKALPDFLEIISNCSLNKKALLLYQQHPRAKADNLDLKMISGYSDALKKNNITTIVSPYSFDEAMVLADKVFYFQTTVIPKCLIAKMDVIQVASVPYPDFAVRNSFVQTASNPKELLRAISKPNRPPNKRAVLSAIGYDKRWKERFISVIEEMRKNHD